MQTSQTVIPSTAGIAVLDLMHALEEIVGSETVAVARANLPAAMRDELATITPLSWLENSIVSAMVDAVAAAAGREPEGLIDQAARRAVERTFKTVWRMFLRIATDEAMIKRTPLIYARSRNCGELTARIVEPGRAELKLAGWPDISDRQARSLGISIEAVVSLTGRRDAHIRFARTAAGVVYDLRWKS
jgi:hypothetical protein